MSAPFIDFIYYVSVNFGSKTPYRTTATRPAADTWSDVKKADPDFLRAVRRTWPAIAWPGGYPLFYVTADNGVLCPKCANKNLKLTLCPDDKQWFIAAADINYEDGALYCDNCSGRIESAYAEPETLQACADCFDVIAGNVDNIDADREGEISAAVAALQTDGAQLIPGTAENEFSWSPCEICGSKLGGKRHDVTLFKGGN